eukprot:g5997.t1
MFVRSRLARYAVRCARANSSGTSGAATEATKAASAPSEKTLFDRIPWTKVAGAIAFAYGAPWLVSYQYCTDARFRAQVEESRGEDGFGVLGVLVDGVERLGMDLTVHPMGLGSVRTEPAREQRDSSARVSVQVLLSSGRRVRLVLGESAGTQQVLQAAGAQDGEAIVEVVALDSSTVSE